MLAKITIDDVAIKKINEYKVKSSLDKHFIANDCLTEIEFGFYENKPMLPFIYLEEIISEEIVRDYHFVYLKHFRLENENDRAFYGRVYVDGVYMDFGVADDLGQIKKYYERLILCENKKFFILVTYLKQDRRCKKRSHKSPTYSYYIGDKYKFDSEYLNLEKFKIEKPLIKFELIYIK